MNRWSFLQTSTVSHSFDDWIPRWPGGFSTISMGCPTAFQSWAADATSQMFFLVRIDQHFLQLQRFIGKSCNISVFIESSDQSLELLTSGKIPVQQHTHIEKVEELGTDLVCFQIAISCFGLESPVRHHILLVTCVRSASKPVDPAMFPHMTMYHIISH